LVATPAAGFKQSKPKKGEVCVGHRVYGDTDIFSKPKNFNFNMRRDNEEKTRFRFIKFATILSFAPIGYLLYNAENKFKKDLISISSIQKKIFERFVTVSNIFLEHNTCLIPCTHQLPLPK